jgi:hypothetical protein
MLSFLSVSIENLIVSSPLLMPSLSAYVPLLTSYLPSLSIKDFLIVLFDLLELHLFEPCLL